jgi:hypothetical protein
LPKATATTATSPRPQAAVAVATQPPVASPTDVDIDSADDPGAIDDLFFKLVSEGWSTSKQAVQGAASAALSKADSLLHRMLGIGPIDSDASDGYGWHENVDAMPAAVGPHEYYDDGRIWIVIFSCYNFIWIVIAMTAKSDSMTRHHHHEVHVPSPTRTQAPSPTRRRSQAQQAVAAKSSQLV